MALPLLLAGSGVRIARAQEAPDVNLLALGWSRGDYRAPLICEMEGSPHRGLRRVLISPGPRHARPATNRMVLYDLEVPPETRCYKETGEVEPNAIGTLYFHFPSISRTDTAQRDFQQTLRREGGFDFQVKSGKLRVGDAGLAPEGLPEVDFRGAKARIATVKRGTDAWRRLSSFSGQRKLTLSLEARDGTRLDLDLVLRQLR